MLFVLYGERFWVNARTGELEARAIEKNYEIFKIDQDSQIPINSFLARDIFGKKIFLVLDNVLESAEYGNEVKALVGDLAKSENIVAIKEDSISNEWLKTLEKAGAKSQEFRKPTASKLSAWLAQKAKELGIEIAKSELDRMIFETDDAYELLGKLERRASGGAVIMKSTFAAADNYFNFADAVSSKRKKQALNMLRAYEKTGVGADEAFWKVWWKTKALRIVDSGKKTTGLHPFVQKKATEDLKNYSAEELKKLSYDLLDLFSDTRRGEKSFKEGLEKIIIES